MQAVIQAVRWLMIVEIHDISIMYSYLCLDLYLELFGPAVTFSTYQVVYF